MYLIKPGVSALLKPGIQEVSFILFPCGKGAIRYIIYVRICAAKQNFREYGENP